MQSNNKLTIPDLISIGVFTAIYFVLVTIATFASALLLPGVSNIFLPAIAALISGSVYMLLAAKLQKFGGITIMGLVMGLFFFVSGHFVLSFAANILFGVLADWVASLGKYYDRKLLFVSYLRPYRSHSAAVVHEGCLRGRPAGPRQGRCLYRRPVCAHQHGNFHCLPCVYSGVRGHWRAVWPKDDQKTLRQSRYRLMRFRMDPRAKLYLLLLANLMLFFHVSLAAEAIMATLFLLLFFLSGCYAAGLRLTAIYGVLLALDLWAVPRAENSPFLNVVALFSVGIRMMLPCIITGAYAFSTTTAGELVCALRSMHVPESVIIPCAVVIRFFPTVGEDYRQIRAAMALRGIAEGKAALLLHPAQSLEYILMPLLMNGNNVAQDLSVAALTKGIGLPGRHTSMIELCPKAADILYSLLCTLPMLLFLGGVL